MYLTTGSLKSFSEQQLRLLQAEQWLQWWSHGLGFRVHRIQPTHARVCISIHCQRWTLQVQRS
jgi:hypothetical protein